jgi:DNA polymerase I-like protein with 3'-5' exonuclease and polymerase domains
VAAYRKRIREEAVKRKHLKTRFGYIRWFWDDRGRDGEAAVSFSVQNDAHGVFKESLLRIDEAGWCDRYWFVLPVHDDLTFDCPDALVAECIANVKPEMERASTVLVNEVEPDGLWVGVEVKTGPNLAEMQEV